MTVIVIETPNRPSRRFEVEVADKGEALISEVEKLVAKFAKAKAAGKKNGIEHSPQFLKARKYLDSIENDPESEKARLEAEAIRKSWIRKND